MGAPGYYLITIGADGEPSYDVNGEPVIDGSLVTLPIQSRLGVEYGTERFDIVLKTERGRTWIYPKYDQQVRRMVFRLTLTQLEDFETLDIAVGGQRDPFIWVVDTDISPPETIFVRKDSSFIVRQLETVAHGEMVDYELNLSEEPTGPEITD